MGRLKNIWVPLRDESGNQICGPVQMRDPGPNRRFTSFIWSFIFWVSKVLVWPAERTVELFLYIFFRDMHPGQFEQCSTEEGEKIHRAFLFVGMLFMGTLAVLLIPFGAPLQYIAITFGTRDFMFYRSSADPQAVPPGSRVHLNIRTQNMCFIPNVSSANNLANPTTRVKFLLKELQLGKHDVICFQEFFDPDAIQAMISSLWRDTSRPTSKRSPLHEDLEARDNIYKKGTYIV